MKKKSEIGKKIGIILSVVLTIGWLFPYIYVICCSFKPGSEVIAVPPSFFPKSFSVEIFRVCWKEWMFLNFFSIV